MIHLDKPIDCKDEDLFDRYSFAKAIGDVLLSTPMKESICMALMGAWGSGKTSIINMVKEYIESEKRKPRVSVLRFEPWNFQTPEQLLGQFFIQLAEFFGCDDSKKGKIGKTISKYASNIQASSITSLLNVSFPAIGIISDLLRNAAANAGEIISNQAFENKSIQKQKDEIQRMLEQSKEKIVIIIDDIDRLTDEQIRCIFQLATIIFKFPNINYLLSFDRSIVAAALDQFQHNRGNDYLEKIIQIPIIMPELRKSKIKTLIAFSLNEIIKKYQIEYIDMGKYRIIEEYCISLLMKTQRDILRLSNEIQTKLNLLYNDVNFIDLVTITILEQHEPALYEWIRQHEEMLTGQLTYGDIEDHDNDQKSIEIRKKKYLEEIDHLIRHRDLFTAKLAMEVLCVLFPSFSSRTGGRYSDYDAEEAREKNSIYHPMKFGRYFIYRVEDEQIQYIDLMFILNDANENEIKQYIIDKDKLGASVELLEEIKSHSHTLNKDRIQLLIYCIAQVGDELKNKTNGVLYEKRASSEAAKTINDLLLLLDKDERYIVIDKMIQIIDVNCIDTISNSMYRVYVANKRKDPSLSRFDQFPSVEDDEYERLEKSYLSKIKDIRDRIEIIDILQKSSFVFLYKQFDEGKNFLIKTITSEPVYVVQYIATHCQATDVEQKEIEITKGYNDLITDEQINNSIQELLRTGEFSNLSRDIQRVVIAYLMKQEDEYKKGGSIEISVIDKRITKMLKALNEYDSNI